MTLQVLHCSAECADTSARCCILLLQALFCSVMPLHSDTLHSDTLHSSTQKSSSIPRMLIA